MKPERGCEEDHLVLAVLGVAALLVNTKPLEVAKATWLALVGETAMALMVPSLEPMALEAADQFEAPSVDRHSDLPP